jgi:hypothetical protein
MFWFPLFQQLTKSPKMKIYAATALLSLASAVLAFEATVPCIMWSPKKYVHVCNDDKN